MKNNKRIINLILIQFIFLVFLSGCGKESGGNNERTSDIDSLDVIAGIITEFPIEGDIICYSSKYPGWERYAVAYYKFDEKAVASIESFAMVSPLLASADEYVVIKTGETDYVKDILEKYLEKRLGDFTGYAPKEAEKLSESQVTTYGDYVALLIHEDRGVEDAFKDTVKVGYGLSDEGKQVLKLLDEKAMELSQQKEDEKKPAEYTDDEKDYNHNRKTLSDGQILIEEIPGVIEPYDTDLIVKAYKTGDESILTDPKDLAVLKKVSSIIQSEIDDDMTEYEKERAIHDYIVSHTDYDSNALIYSDWYSEYADQPYGCLIDNRAICLGYAGTFKMFMDILDIECIIVKGTANLDNANHAWNLVKLEDENWYAVDVTWDDVADNPIVYYNYFNVDDVTLSSTRHYWEESEYPSAKGGKYSGLEKPLY